MSVIAELRLMLAELTFQLAVARAWISDLEARPSVDVAPAETPVA